MKVNLKVNGMARSWEVRPDETLIETLRSHGYHSLRAGCGSGQCGICTLHVDGKAVLGCLLLTAKTEGREVLTLEGTGDAGREVAEILVSEGVDQCGYCAPGTIMTILYLKKCLKDPSDAEILQFMNGNLCRCSGYAGQLRAIRRYLEASK